MELIGFMISFAAGWMLCRAYFKRSAAGKDAERKDGQDLTDARYEVQLANLQAFDGTGRGQKRLED